MKLQPFAKGIILYELNSNLDYGDYPDKVGSGPMGGRDATWGQHIRVLWLFYIFLIKVNFEMRIADRKATTCIGKAVSAPLWQPRSTTTGTLLLDSPSPEGS